MAKGFYALGPRNSKKQLKILIKILKAFWILTKFLFVKKFLKGSLSIQRTLWLSLYLAALSDSKTFFFLKRTRTKKSVTISSRGFKDWFQGTSTGWVNTADKFFSINFLLTCFMIEQASPEKQVMLLFFFLIWAKAWLHFLKVPCLWETNLVSLMKRKHNVIENVIRNYSSLILQVCNFPGSWSPIDFCTPP